MPASSVRKPSRGVVNDRLQLALQVPERAAGWHGLHRVLSQLDAAERAPALDHIRARRPASSGAAMLAATMLDSFTSDTSELANAAKAFVASVLPVDAGQALLNAVYARGLREAVGADGMVSHLHSADFLSVARAVGDRLVANSHRLPGAGSAISADAPAPLARWQAVKLAVVAPSLSTGFHAPTHMAISHAVALAELGADVTVFSPQEFFMPNMADWLGAPRNMSLSALDRSGWPLPVQGTLKLVIPDPMLSMGGRWQALLAAIGSFAPHAVLFIGPFSPLLWPLHARYPLLGLGTNAICPPGPLDVWLAPTSMGSPWTASIAAPGQRLHTGRLNVAQASATYDLTALAIPSDALVWLTSGSRLHSELSEEWTRGVLSALERQPHAHWLIVGGGNDLPRWVPVSHPRIHTLGFQKALGSLMLACDVYLNPPRLGGGFSVAMAMAHSLPALSFSGCDGGDKVGQFAVADLPAYVSRLEAWTTDAELRAHVKHAQHQHYQSTFDLRGSLGPLLDAVTLAQHTAAARLAHAAPPPA